MVDIRFIGEYTFRSKMHLQKALKEVIESITEEDESVKSTWAESHFVNDLKVVININIGCTQDDFWVYEGIVETLSEYAKSGSVEGWRDDYSEGEIEFYNANFNDEFE